jgi:glycosyltransferase involved in cell wall biosynthesis
MPLSEAMALNIPVIGGEASGADTELAGDLIAIGTLEPRKNQGYLLQVLAACKKRGKSYLLTLVGDGPDREKLAQLAASLGVAAQVNFLGFMPNAACLIANHRILVHAAEIENMPLTLIESLSYGRPILAASVGGIPEIISDGVEGYFWDLDDPESGAGILISLLEDPVRQQHMSERARLTYQARFHPSFLADQWLNTIMR